MSLEDLLDAWRKNEVVNQRLLALCSDESFEAKPGKGKTIRSNWVHLIGIRRAHVEAMLAPAAEPIPKLDWKTATREEIAHGLATSAEATATVLERLDAKPIRWTAASLFGYSVAHEANHRAQIEIALRLNGFEPTIAALYDLWNWPKM